MYLSTSFIFIFIYSSCYCPSASSSFHYDLHYSSSSSYSSYYFLLSFPILVDVPFMILIWSCLHLFSMFLLLRQLLLFCYFSSHFLTPLLTSLLYLLYPFPLLLLLLVFLSFLVFFITYSSNMAPSKRTPNHHCAITEVNRAAFPEALFYGKHIVC